MISHLINTFAYKLILEIKNKPNVLEGAKFLSNYEGKCFAVLQGKKTDVY